MLVNAIGKNSVPIRIARIIHDFARQPRMVEDVFAGKSQLGIGLQHVYDEIAHTIADIVPVRGWKIKVPVQDGIKKLLLLIVG